MTELAYGRLSKLSVSGLIRDIFSSSLWTLLCLTCRTRCDNRPGQRGQDRVLSGAVDGGLAP